MIEAPAVAWKAAEYGNGKAHEAVALVAGFDGTISTLDHAARDLAATGRDVVVYEYDPAVFLDGDPGHFPNVINTLSADFHDRTPDYRRRRYAGVSLGGAIGASMQKREADPEPGMFAATGIDAALLVMRNPLFQAVVRLVHHVNVRRAFEANGHTLRDMQALWQDIQIPPTTPFTLALGGLDYIVQRREMAPKVAAWHATNPGFRVIHRPRLGHTGMIKWFNDNVGQLLVTQAMTTLSTEPVNDRVRNPFAPLELRTE